MLIEIKSRMLLPAKPSADGAEPEDPRAELVRRLIEYEQMKLAAMKLDAMPVIERDFLRAQVTIEQSLEPRFPDVNIDDLREAWADILKRAKLNQHHRISREQLSVREYMTKVLRRLQGVRFVEFQDLFEVDHGPILAQQAVDVLPSDTEATFHERIKEVERTLYVRTIRQIVERGSVL